MLQSLFNSFTKRFNKFYSTGEIVSLVRGCETEPIVENGVRTDKHYTKMYTSCNTDRCNSGDGKRRKSFNFYFPFSFSFHLTKMFFV